MHPVEFSVCPASAAPAAVPADDAVRPGAGFASRLSVVGNMAMEICTRALDQIAPGRVLRLTWELSPVGLMLGTLGMVQARVVPAASGPIAIGAQAMSQLRYHVLPDLRRCTQHAGAIAVSSEQAIAHCLGRAARAVCERGAVVPCAETLVRSVGLHGVAPGPDAPLTAADIARADRSITAQFRQSRAFLQAMETLAWEFSLLGVEESPRPGPLSAGQLLQRARHSSGWAAFRQRAVELAPDLNAAYRVAVERTYALRPDWMDEGAKQGMQRLADARYPVSGRTGIGDEALRWMAEDLAWYRSSRPRVIAR